MFEYGAPEGIEPVETWNVLDATKLNRWQECPRAFFYEFVLGWRPEETNINLIFGRSFHEGMEHLMKTQTPGEGWTKEHIAEAYDIFLTDWRRDILPTSDNDYTPKNPASARTAFDEYAERYKHERHQVLHTEVSGELPLSVDAGRSVHYKIDAVCEDAGGVFALEHKTASRDSGAWRAGWQTSLQVNIYYLALLANLGHSPHSIIINGVVLRKSGHGYIRIPIAKTNEQLAELGWQLEHLLSEVEHSHKGLANESASQKLMYSFPKRTTSCTKWGRACPYIHMCAAWSNPLQHTHKLPVGMAVQHWDPRHKEEEDAS